MRIALIRVAQLRTHTQTALICATTGSGIDKVRYSEFLLNTALRIVVQAAIYATEYLHIENTKA